MALNLGALGALGSGITPGYLDAQQKQAALREAQMRQLAQRQQMQELADQRIGHAAGAIPYATPMPAPVPQGAGQPSVPAAPTPPVPAGGYNGPAPAPVPSPPTGGAAAPTVPPKIGGYDVRQMAAQIKRLNPGITGNQLYYALQTNQQLYNQQGRQEMQQLQMEFKLQTLEETLKNRGALQDQKIQSQMDMLRERQENQRWMTTFVQNSLNNRAANTEEGRNSRFQQGEQDKATRQGVSEAGKNTRAAGAQGGKNDPDRQTFTDATKEADAADRDINEIVRSNNGTAPGPDTEDGKEIARLRQVRNQKRQEADNAYKKLRAKGQAQPYNKMREEARKAASPAAAAPSDSGGGQDSPAKPTTQEEFDALPSGAVYVNPADGKTYRKN